MPPGRGKRTKTVRLLLLNVRANVDTHSLRQHDAEHEDREKARGRKPSVEHEGRDPVEPLLVLPPTLGVVEHERLEGASRGLWVG